MNTVHINPSKKNPKNIYNPHIQRSANNNFIYYMLRLSKDKKKF